MHWINRILDLPALLKKKSYFLLGPRQTGKTSLLTRSLPDARVYDLLDTAVYLDLSRDPSRIEQELKPGDELVVIDEIQRLPQLLNEAHRLIETRGLKFLLTGSSARKLRRGGVNLLGGRARTVYLHPLSFRELGDRFELERALRFGLIPSIYFSDDPAADLQAYTGMYLQQEIMAESALRNVPAFSRFLRVAALCNGTVVNFTAVANDAQVARTTVYEYFDILRDTLIMHELPAWRATRTRKPIVSSKYYFFDTGAVAALQGRTIAPGTPEFGVAFETFIMHELVCRRDYVTEEPLSYWRSTSGFEVDFIIGDHTLVEVKAKKNISLRDIKSLKTLGEEQTFKRFLCVCLEQRPRTAEGIEILPYRLFLENLWAGAYGG